MRFWAVAGTHRDDNGGCLHVRQEIDRKPLPGKPADQCYGEGDNADCNGAANGESGERLEESHFLDDCLDTSMTCLPPEPAYHR